MCFRNRSNCLFEPITKNHGLTVNNKIKPLHLTTNKSQLNFLEAFEIKKHQKDIQITLMNEQLDLISSPLLDCCSNNKMTFLNVAWPVSTLWTRKDLDPDIPMRFFHVFPHLDMNTRH